MTQGLHHMRICLRARLATCILLLVALACAGDALDSWRWRNPLPQGNSVLGVAGGDGTFVAVGDKGTILVSSNATIWTPVSVGSALRFFGVTYHAGQFVAAGPGIWTSSNGVNWIQRDANYLYAVTWGNGVFVAAGYYGNILTSTNGIDWFTQNSGTTQPLNGLTWANGLFVAVGGHFTNSVLLTSTDAVLWTNRSISSDILNAVTYGNGMFMAVGFHFYGNTAVSLASPNGVNWTRHVLGPQIYSASGVAFDRGLFVLAGSDGIFTATDGVNWTKRYGEFPNGMSAATSANGIFVTVGHAGAIVTSPDGTNWTR